MAIKAVLPSLLQTARLQAGLSQRGLAAQAGTAQSIVARIERDQANPTLETIERLFEAAGFDLELTLKPKPAPDPLTDAFKRDIDRTLLRENLNKTPQQRMQGLVAMTRLFDEMQRARAKRTKRR